MSLCNKYLDPAYFSRGYKNLFGAPLQNVCRHCHYSLSPVETRRTHKRQIFEIEKASVKAALRQSEIMGVDETCISINGENNWIHIGRDHD